MENSESDSMDSIMAAIGKGEQWWERTKLFEARTPSRRIQELLTKNPPNTLKYVEYIRKNMYVLRQGKVEREGLGLFFQVLVEEISRVGRMPIAGSRRAAVELFLEVKLKLLQVQDHLYFGGNYFVHYHDQIDHWLSTMLQSGRSASYRFGDKSYVDAAKACRELRRVMKTRTCLYRKTRCCIYNVLLPTLHTLQLQTYEEIRYKVDTAIDTRLPAELVDMIFEETMLAEGAPLDPRVFVNAQHTTSGTRLRKSRIVCSHGRRKSTPTESFRLDGSRPTIAIGPTWTELEPVYPHRDARARARMDKKYFWYAFGYLQMGDER